MLAEREPLPVRPAPPRPTEPHPHSPPLPAAPQTSALFLGAHRHASSPNRCCFISRAFRGLVRRSAQSESASPAGATYGRSHCAGSDPAER